ncbi:DUF4157 domain-containing protein [Paenibacillus sp. TRM 82003]|nr:DUF4157 domain-containing protein [Paenibacillus sp. TRM 82003]
MSFHRRQAAPEHPPYARSTAVPGNRASARDPIAQLQQGLGNRGVQRLISQTVQRQAIQRMAAPEEEELQMKRDSSTAKAIQRMAAPEEEELQMKRDSSTAKAIQRMAAPEEEELQMKRNPVQAKTSPGGGLPDGVKQTMESSFGADFSDVRIHEGSMAAGIGALAYAQGSDIHFAPGQYDPGSRKGQELLGHELTHVVQQRQGRVRPTGSIGGLPLNDDKSLESEADRMGAKAAGEMGRSTAP